MTPDKHDIAKTLQKNFTDTERVLGDNLRLCDSGTMKFYRISKD